MEVIEVKEQDETGNAQNIWTNQNTYAEIIIASFLITFAFIPNWRLFLWLFKAFAYVNRHLLNY